MIDFSRKPSPKSEQETRFDEVAGRYEAAFGVPYVFSIGLDFQTWEEAIADVERRIAEKDPQQPPDYEEGVNY